MTKKILIADDDVSVLRFMNDFFNRNHPKYNVENYRTGEAVEGAFKELGLSNIKLVILDHVMDPGLRGLELIKKYSNIARFLGCKMMLHTGENLEKQAMKYGAFGYIAKPMSYPEMEKIIANALK